MKKLNNSYLCNQLLVKLLFSMVFVSIFLNILYAQPCDNSTLVTDYTYHQDCNTKNIHFSDNSNVYSGNITAYLWNFGDGGTSSLQNPDHTYTAVGNYTISLTLTHSSGCISVKTSVLTVLSPPIANFMVSIDSVCSNQLISFTNSSIGSGLKYEWYFRDGTNYYALSDTSTNPMHHFYAAIGNAYQTFDVMLKVNDQNNCFDTTSHAVVIKQSPAADFVEIGNFRRCENVIAAISDTAIIYNYSNTSQISSYQIDWGIGNGFVTITSLFSATSYISNVYTSVNNYPIAIKAYGYNGCYTIFRDTFEIITIPLPEFSSLSFSSGCIPFAVYTVNNSSSITPNTFTSINWGDNTIDSLPIGRLPGDTLWHYYTHTTCINGSQQPYNIILTTKNECGSPFKSYGPVNAFSPPEADFDIYDDSVCVGNPAIFQNHSIPNFCAANPRTLYTWNFGDSVVTSIMATTTNPTPSISHIYNLPGIYTVILKAENNSLPSTGHPGCGSSSDTLRIFVFETNANFEYDTVCYGYPTHFTDLSSAPGGNIISTSWDFGDGSSSTQQNPQHLYNSPGQYFVSLSASGSFGCTDVITKMITVDSLPIADFTYTKSCYGDTTFFNNLSVSNADSIAHYFWDFGDSSQLSTLKNPFHIYQLPGNYNVTLSIYNSKFCKKDTIIDIIIHSNPIASFFTDTVCLGYQRIFTNNSIPGGGIINSHFWTMGDGIGTSTNIDTSYIYSGTGTYPVQLKISDVNGCIDDTSLNIYLGPVPVAAFLSDTVCFGTPTHFLNTTNSQGIPFTSVWDFSDGSNSTLSNPNHIFNILSTYNVFLKVSNINGCTDSINHTITLKKLPNPFFTATTVCLGDTTKFSDLSTTDGPLIISRNWNFGDGINSALQNPTHIYQNSGTYNVTLTITDNKGCINDTTISVLINALPSPSFIVTSPCKGQTSNFSSISANPSYTFWEWKFGVNNDSSNLQSPSYMYSQSGNYNIHLTVNDTNGCIGDTVQSIFISPLPLAAFVFDTVCFGNATHFTDISTDSNFIINNWNWSFGDFTVSNDTNPFHVFNNAGFYNTTLTITNNYGCVNSKTLQVGVDTIPHPSFFANHACLGSNTIFNDVSTTTGVSISAWHWDFGDGSSSFVQHPQHLYGSSGVFNVNLICTKSNGCSKDTSIEVTIHPLPIPDFSLNSVCVNNSITFIYHDTLAPSISWEWDFGDGITDTLQQPLHSFLNSGNYIVKLHIIDSNLCEADTLKNIFISPIPVSNFIFDTNCMGEAIHFINLSVDSVSFIVSWNWDFGDFSSSVLNNPDHFYSNSGNFNVRLQVMNAYGCTDSIIKTIQLDSLPYANFTANNVAVGNTTSFNDVSISNATNINSWQWDFGDGTTSVLQNTLHTYAQADSFNVRLIVINNHGCKDSIIKKVIVFPLPNPDFIVLPVCFGDSSLFNDNSLSLGGNILSWHWDFGDGNSSNLQNPVHYYINPGNYTTWLTVIDINGNLDSISHIAVVKPNPISFFYTDTVCSGDTTHFFNLSSSIAAPINSWSWDFGDGSPSSILKIPSHKYITVSTLTTYNVYLKVTDSLGCSDTSVHQISIYPPVKADFISDTVCNNSAVQLTDISSSEAGNIVSWEWDFGTSTSFVKIPAFSFTNILTDSIFTIHLIVADNLGCKDSVTHPLLVHPQPIVIIKSDTSCLGLITHFLDSSYSYGGAINSWNWNFDGTGISSLQNPSHLFLNSGIFNTTLSVKDINGCENSATIPIIVDSIPEANFSFHGNCASGLINFTDLTIPHGSINNSWQWNFGDAYSSTLINPIHYYTAVDTFDVTLRVSNVNGCYGITTKHVYVNPSMSYDFFSDTVCLGLMTHFTDSFLLQTTQLSAYLWNFGDGFSSTLHNPQHLFSAPGIYNVALTVIDTNSCTETIHHNIIVHAKPLADFTSSNVCIGDTTRFFNNSVSASTVISYFWDFGDGFSSILYNPSHLYNSSGNYIVKLFILNANGCSDSVIKTVSVNSKPVANFNVGSICSGFPVVISDSSLNVIGSINTWLWDFGDGDSLLIPNPSFYLPTISHAYSNSGSYTIHLMISNNVCSDTISRSIVVFPNPVAGFTVPDKCLRDTSRFTETSLSNGIPILNRIWNFGDGINSNLQHPIHIYPFAGNYLVTLTVTDANACSNSIVKTVKIFSLPIASFIANIAPFPTPTYFLNTSIGTPAAINTWHWNFSDGIGSSNLQNPVYTFVSIDTFNTRLIVIDTNGCKDTVFQPVVVCSPIIHANFGYTTACENSFTYFTDSTFINNVNDVLNYSWNFGDGATSILKNPQHQFINSGVYTVRLIVKGIFGNSDTIYKNITIHSKPIADFDEFGVCKSVNKTFTDLSTVQSGNIIHWHWNFGNGNSANTLSHSTIYNTYSYYNVQLIITTDMGCIDSITKIVKVHPVPVLNFSSDIADGCLPVSVNFSSIANVDSGFIAFWNWNFGDASTALLNSNQTFHTYLNEGSYNVTLNVISNNGCSTNLVIPNMIVVHPNPEAIFSVTPSITSILNSKISFIDNSTETTNWKWYFGDGDSSDMRSPIHHYNQDGTYFPRLTATSDYGCTDETTMKVVILKEATFYIPNAFTPNNDGYNDVFMPLSIDFSKGKFEMMIFNRWGEMVFRTEDYNYGWNGSWNGNGDTCPDGVYVWKINYTDALGRSQKETGYLTLIR